MTWAMFGSVQDRCRRCRCIRLGTKSFTDRSLTIPLGKIAQWDRECDLCHTLARLAGVEGFGETGDVPQWEDDALEWDADGEVAYCIVPFNTLTLFENSPSAELRDWESAVSYAVVEEENTGDGYEEELFNCVRGRGWLSPEPLEKHPVAGSAVVLGTNLDPAAISAELFTCKSSHDGCSHGFLRECIEPIKLVNCSTGRIVERLNEEPYLTLSYVYSAAIEDLDRHRVGEPLRRPLPPLMEDTMQLTLELGYNYLWVDRYCITQASDPDSLRERKLQIGQMDQIYTRSDMTIIAADGVQGLSGVTDRRRSRKINISGIGYVLCPPTPRFEIENSECSERAWCYQEGILSTRRLIVLKDQFYFECNTSHCIEGLVGRVKPVGNLQLSSSQQSGNDEVAFEPIRRWNEFEVFNGISSIKSDPLDHVYNHIAEYTKRRLTASEDILNAIAGTFAQLKQMYPEMAVISGVPILPRTALERSSKLDRLITSLCWKTAFICERRPDFPSWSWAGWYLPGGIKGQSPLFQARCGSAPFLNAGEQSLVAHRQVKVRLGAVEGGGEDGARHGSSDSMIYLAKGLMIEAPMLDVRFGRAGVVDGHYSLDTCTSFVVEGSRVTCEGKLFPPSDRFKSQPVLTLVSLGRGRTVAGVGKTVMLVVVRTGEAACKRVGVVDVDENVERSIRELCQLRSWTLY